MAKPNLGNALQRRNDQRPPAPDDWVNAGAVVEAPKPVPVVVEPTKRLTLDIPESLHRRFKLDCVERGVDMVEDFTAWLRERYPETKK